MGKTLKKRKKIIDIYKIYLSINKSKITWKNI